MDLLEPRPGSRILDLGCGIGYLAGLAAKRGAGVVGMDIHHDAVAHASRTVHGSFAVASAFALPFVESCFDGIVFADVIEHLARPEAVLQELHRTAKPGARVVISTPHLGGWLTGTWVTSMLHGEVDEHMADERPGYTAEELCAVMSAGGIEPDEVRLTNPFSSQLLLGLVKWAYRLTKRTYGSQRELVEVSRTWKFMLYRYALFPFGYALGRAEEALLGRLIPGHCLIVRGSVRK